MPAHIKLHLGGLGASFELTPGEVRHPLLASITSERDRPEPEEGEETPELELVDQSEAPTERSTVKRPCTTR
jgi:hypothetical protein